MVSRSAAGLAAAAVLALLAAGCGGSTANGTPLQMGADSGDLSYPWRVSYHHYMTG